LIKINKEAKVRRSIRSVVLGKARLMSYEDLEEARAKRAAKEKTTLGKFKGKRGRKGRSSASEAGTRQLEIDVTRMSVVLELWGAPIGQMY
jgi:hypothetical protein